MDNYGETADLAEELAKCTSERKELEMPGKFQIGVRILDSKTHNYFTNIILRRIVNCI